MKKIILSLIIGAIIISGCSKAVETKQKEDTGTKISYTKISQDEAKKMVAIALRNRYRRAHVDEAMREEINPKNILMIGPTGVGKTEIARRLAKLVGAPFIKVEATKFTEVGYVGRDVESIIRDLVENAVRMVRDQKIRDVQPRAQVLADDRIISMILNPNEKKAAPNPLDFLLGKKNEEKALSVEEKESQSSQREELRHQLLRGELEDRELDIEVEEDMPSLEVGGSSISIGDMMGGMMPKKTKIRHVKVSEARKILTQQESEKLIDMDAIQEEAVRRAENDGIV